MDDLITRTRSAIDEDERIADGALSPDPDGPGWYMPDHYVTAEQDRFERRFTPDAVKAIIAAHRKILDHIEHTHQIATDAAARIKASSWLSTDLSQWNEAQRELSTLGVVLEALAECCGNPSHADR